MVRVDLSYNTTDVNWYHQTQTQNNLFVTQQQKNPYICNQKIKIHYNICCADQETCIKINVDRYHAGHQLEKNKKT